MLLLAALSVACGPAHQPVPQPGPHPIIIIDIDTLRADHLGCYGYHRDTSPNIDALASQSVLFEYAFAQAPNTPPSQTSILTGLYPSTHGMVFDEDKVPDAVVTMAEALLEIDFTTAGFHDGGYMSNSFNMGQGFQVYTSSKGGGLAKIGPKVSTWLDNHADEDFLLLVHTYDAHSPYAPPEPFKSQFIEGLAPPSPGFEPTSDILEEIRLSVWTDEVLTLEENDLEYTKARYDGGISYIDDWVGRFLSDLEARGLLDRATIVFLSDHGEEFMEHGSVLHEKLYSTVTRVPFMIRLPGGNTTGRVTEVIENIDLMPTVLDLVGAPHPPGLEGSSLVPLLAGAPSTAGMAFGESPFFGHRRFAASGIHQLLLTKNTGSVELYDFVQDPHEQMDLTESKPEVVDRLRLELDAWQERVEVSPFEVDAAPGELDAETIEQLKELGYIQD